MSYPRLNLPSIKLRVTSSKRSGKLEVWDTLRRKHLVLTPEEWVRQHIIHHLIAKCGMACELLCCEYPIEINGTSQRADIAILTPTGEVQLLVECKAPNIAIDETTAAQILRYCAVAKPRYALLSNGLEHRLFALQDGRYTPLPFDILESVVSRLKIF